MFYVAFTPNDVPAHALSAKAPTLMAALADLFKSLDALQCDEWFVAAIMEAAKEAVDALEDGEDAFGSWYEMSCPEDAFRIDIFCADGVRIVQHEGKQLLAPHNAVGLSVPSQPQHSNCAQWLYDEAEIADWESVLRPQPLSDEPPKITKLLRSVLNGECSLSAIFDDGSQKLLFSFFVDELAFSDADLIGKTEAEARQLRQQRDMDHLKDF